MRRRFIRKWVKKALPQSFDSDDDELDDEELFVLLEELEAMPEAGVSVLVAGYPVEIVQVQDRMVKTARIGPRRVSD